MSLLLERSIDLSAPILAHLSDGPFLEPGKTYPAGRTCERWGCVTRLSIYNPGPDFCWAHQVDDFRPRLAA